MPDVETLKDVVILGRAAPETLSGSRLTVCTGAWSEHLGFIRLYPCDPEDDLFSRWDVIDVEVCRNPQDNRDESWKLARSDQASCITKTGEYTKEQRAALLTHVSDDCVEDIKERGRSLGVVQPKSISGLEFKDWDDDDGTIQTRLFEEKDEWQPETRDEFDQEIRVEFTCPGCKTKQGYHNKTLLEWGAYLGAEKNDLSAGSELEEFYNLNDKDYKHWIFVGNQNNHRTSFIAINILWMKDDVPIYKPIGKSFPKISDSFVHPAEK